MLPFMLALLAFFSFQKPETERAGRQVPEPVTAPPPLLVRVDLPDLVPSGLPLPFRLVLANRGDAPIQVELGGRPIAFDLLVTGADGKLLWRRLEGVAVESILVIRTLAPGEVISFEDHWDQRDGAGRLAPPGSYRVRGVLRVAGAPGGWGSAPRDLTITP